MAKTKAKNPTQEAKQRVEQGLEALRQGLDPYVAKHMEDRHGNNWRQYASRAQGGGAGNDLDVYALLKTLLDNWQDLFRNDVRLRKARSFVSLCIDARNNTAHFAGKLEAREALRHLDAIRELLLVIGADAQRQILDSLYEEQRGADKQAPPAKSAGLELDEPAPPSKLRPWREVCEPHPDVLEARFSDAEFAANLALVDQGEGSEEYLDPAAFFRITYATEGLQRVLTTTVARLAAKGGDPVIGLQTNFGGGKTHTMLALHHLAGAVEAGYQPKELTGLGEIFSAAGVETLGRVKRAVFVGTHKGAAEAMHIEGTREIRTLWGYIAWRLGGWEAFDSIADSEKARTNPGSEKLIPILRDATPCLILMDEVVAFARQLRELEYDAFHAFIQSLTEAAAAVQGAVVVGSLPESGAEVGDEQGKDALKRLEKIFGRVQSAWTPASGIETFEIVRRRLFQPLDETGEKARADTISAFRKLYRDHRADFPAEVRETAYAEQMRRAWPLHPELLRRFSGDWSVLEKFQKTRGILKIMANVVYALWSSESNAPIIMPALLPFRDTKVRTALLEPLHGAFEPILQGEVDGEASLTAKIETQRPRFSKTRAATLAARAVFFATAPHNGAARGGMSGTELRLSCAQPGDQIAIYGEALQEIASRSAHLYRDGDSYWFSPQPTLNKLAADRAQDISDEQADLRIIELLREEQRSRAGFPRVHAAPDNPTDIDDRRSTALIILPPSASHETGAESKGTIAASETIERRGSGQRRFRNALVFIAADASNVGTARDNARRERAWHSIVNDRDLNQNLTLAQADDAKSSADRSLEALRQSIRGAWVQVLHSTPPDGSDSQDGSGYVIRSTRIVNRGGAKSIPQAVWDKVSNDGTVTGDMGPENFLQSLEPIWPEGRNHLAISEIRDWFASYVYLPRLRDEATLDGAIQRLVSDLASRYAFASGFDEEKGEYSGVIDNIGVLHNIGEGLLVRREAIQREEREGGESTGTSPPGLVSPDPPGGGENPNQPPTPPKPQPGPKRFFATIPIEAERAGLDVARIMDGLLVELTRTKGSSLRLILEIEGTVANDGYPQDVVETVKANARDLKLDDGSYGFEQD